MGRQLKSLAKALARPWHPLLPQDCPEWSSGQLRADRRTRPWLECIPTHETRKRAAIDTSAWSGAHSSDSSVSNPFHLGIKKTRTRVTSAIPQQARFLPRLKPQLASHCWPNVRRPRRRTSNEFRNELVRAIMRAWYTVQDHGGWPEAPATRNLPPPPPALTVVRDVESERG
jgi:hypothetical protein